LPSLIAGVPSRALFNDQANSFAVVGLAQKGGQRMFFRKKAAQASLSFDGNGKPVIEPGL
jgi:hypothetical protein